MDLRPGQASASPSSFSNLLINLEFHVLLSLLPPSHWKQMLGMRRGEEGEEEGGREEEEEGTFWMESFPELAMKTGDAGVTK